MNSKFFKIIILSQLSTFFHLFSLSSIHKSNLILFIIVIKYIIIKYIMHYKIYYEYLYNALFIRASCEVWPKTVLKYKYNLFISFFSFQGDLDMFLWDSLRNFTVQVCNFCTASKTKLNYRTAAVAKPVQPIAQPKNCWCPDISMLLNG